MLKRLLFIILAGMIASCSAGGDADTELANDVFNGEYSTSNNVTFHGSWQWADNVASAAGLPAEQGTVQQNGQRFVFSNLPTRLLLGLAGYADAATSDSYRLSAPYFVKGYSANTTIYSVELASELTFAFTHADAVHTARVVIDSPAEIAVNSYNQQLSLAIMVRAIYVDGTLTDAPGGLLLFNAY